MHGIQEDIHAAYRRRPEQSQHEQNKEVLSASLRSGAGPRGGSGAPPGHLPPGVGRVAAPGRVDGNEKGWSISPAPKSRCPSSESPPVLFEVQREETEEEAVEPESTNQSTEEVSSVPTVVTDKAISKRAQSSAKCEDCTMKHKNYGLAEEGYRKRWCGACAKENHPGAALKPVKVAAPAAARKPVQSRKRAKSRQPVTVKSRNPIMM